MTYAEAFGWIGENVEMDEEESFDNFVLRLRDTFYSQGLIDKLVEGVETDFQSRQVRQLSLKEFYEQLNPKTKE